MVLEVEMKKQVGKVLNLSWKCSSIRSTSRASSRSFNKKVLKDHYKSGIIGGCIRGRNGYTSRISTKCLSGQ